MRDVVRTPVLLMAALLLASPALGRAVTDVEGDWGGPAVTKVRVRGVGGDKATSSDTVQVMTGTWSAHNSVGWDYSGTWFPNGKKLTWMFSTGSYGELESMLDTWAANLGFGGAQTVVSSVTTNSKATESKKKGRKLKITAKVKFTASLKGKLRKGKAKLKGKYTPR